MKAQALILVLLSLWACGGGDDHHAGESEGASSGALCSTNSMLTYESFGEPFMESYCIRCHSSELSGDGRKGAPDGHDFDSLEGILAVVDHVDEYAAAGPDSTNEMMPPDGPYPSLEERQMLGAWLACETVGPLATVEWAAQPPATTGVGTTFEASWMVVTEGETHISELRACKGVVDDCALGGEQDASAIATSDGGGAYSADLALPEAGAWTVVAWAHVDTAPYVSDAITVTVE